MNSEQNNLLARIQYTFQKDATKPVTDLPGVTLPKSTPARTNLKTKLYDLYWSWLWTGARKHEGTQTLWFPPDLEQSWRPAPLFRKFVYNPVTPEFDENQRLVWSTLIGVLMGILCKIWKDILERGVEWVWVTLPTALFRAGILTDPQGARPIVHYVWIVPCLLGAFLGYWFDYLDIPGQDEWIRGLHCRGGVQQSQQHGHGVALFILATIGMVSGLCLGPEMPLILVGSVIPWYMARLCGQSVLQTRILTLTGSAAAVASFFSFPMSGAIFVLEMPHTMGLQYWEAIIPAVFSSCVATGVHTFLSGEPFSGIFNYPPLPQTLPAEVFADAVVIGLVGCALGVVYLHTVKFTKTVTHGLFQKQPSEETIPDTVPSLTEEEEAIINRGSLSPTTTSPRRCALPTSKGVRAALAGGFLGACVGGINVFLPHVAFWGEAQLQTIIDHGVTPLPIFGETEGPIANFTQYAFCMGTESEPYSPGCSFAIGSAKILATGLSLGTGILGGHFWGPLFVGCSGAHVFMKFVETFSGSSSWGHFLIEYPALVLLCMMGATHVVTFRAPISICLILILTVKFNGGDTHIALPLLVVSIVVALMLSKRTQFYKAQRSRSDLEVVKEALCQPGMEGMPLVANYAGIDDTMTEIWDESDVDGQLPIARRSTAGSVRSLKMVPAFGDVKESPCVVTQARLRAASSSSFMEVYV